MSEEKVIALGFFDGVHIGHGALLRRTVELAQELGYRSAAFTFDRSPRAYVTGKSVPLLSTVDRRCELIRTRYGVEEVLVAPFDHVMMATPWEKFVDMLVDAGARYFIAGEDFRFGHRNEGDVERLAYYCAQRGIGCEIIPKVQRDWIPVSSTHIRELLARGETEEAAAFLGYAYAIDGTVVHGCGRGSQELVPTANIQVAEGLAVPARGTYATRVTLADGRSFPAVSNIGTCPTVRSTAAESIETHLIGFAGDLYGERICIAFGRRLREEKHFADVELLREQIMRDIAEAAADAENGKL